MEDDRFGPEKEGYRVPDDPAQRKQKKPPRETYNIQFSQELPTYELITVLQYELLRARDQRKDVVLLQALVHDIKFRLSWYLEKHGEVLRPPRRPRGPAKYP